MQQKASSFRYSTPLILAITYAFRFLETEDILMNYDCQKVVRRLVVLINVRRLIFVIKAREYWVIIKRTPSR